MSQAYSITAIIDTAKQVQQEIADKTIWDAMSLDQKTEWFLAQCKKHNLTPEINKESIYIKELKSGGQKAYFIAFLPRENSGWHMEIGGSYYREKNGGLWSTASGIIGKEMQIEQVMRLHNQGE